LTDASKRGLVHIEPDRADADNNNTDAEHHPSLS